MLREVEYLNVPCKNHISGSHRTTKLRFWRMDVQSCGRHTHLMALSSLLCSYSQYLGEENHTADAVTVRYSLSSDIL